MRLIDADKARKEATIDLVVHLLDRQPTIDAVPVVRCKGCKHYKTHNPVKSRHSTKLYCVRSAVTCTAPNDFCSYGEPRGERKE